VHKIKAIGSVSFHEMLQGHFKGLAHG